MKNRPKIQLALHDTCTGCTACASVCPTGSISMREDQEGFLQPHIEVDSCIQCHKCEKTCPILNPIEIPVDFKTQAYAAINKDEEVRKDSTSGGIFSALATAQYNDGGFVGGAIYTENFKVKHVVSNDINDLPKLRSSKYLQSDVTDFFNNVKSLLEANEKVLVCGTPCQIAALKKFVGKLQQNLVTVDFICRGVSSPMIWQMYLRDIEEKHCEKLISVKAKSKDLGWRNLTYKFVFQSGYRTYQTKDQSPYMIGFRDTNVLCRKSCYNCIYKGFPRVADISLGDCWGIDNGLDDNLGTSLVLANTPTGASFLRDKIGKFLSVEKINFSDVPNSQPCIMSSLPMPTINREIFYQDAHMLSFDQLSQKYFMKHPFLKQVKKQVKGVLSRYKRIGISLDAWKTYFNIKAHTKNFGVGKIVDYKYIAAELDEGSVILLSDSLKIGLKRAETSKQETRLMLRKNSQLIIDGAFLIHSGCDIHVKENAKLILHGGYFNTGVSIKCEKQIEIGNDCAIAHGVLIQDSDFHSILRDDYVQCKSISIGNHVWIGEGAQILKGVTIGDGAIVASGSIVTHDVPSKTLVAGVPAKVIRSNVEWEL